MRVKKKINHYVIILIILAVVPAGVRCNFKPNKNNEEKSVRVTFVDCAPNDLGQVMIFGQDEKGGKLAFRKNFYDERSSQKEIKNRMNKYIRSIEQKRNKIVKIIYYNDDVGDMIIVDMQNP
jgi:hypothetical protein